MDGGALIGRGTFGCVFDPPLHVISRVDGKCTKLKVVGRTVGKISESEEVANEIQASKALSEIPNAALYFATVDLGNINRPCAADVQSDRASLAECPIIKKTPMSHMLHFTMPYSGIGMSKHFTIHVKDKTPLPIEKVITHLLEAAALLVLNNFVHYDLHPENVLFDDKTKMPRIIDFGFSFSATEIEKETLDTRWKVYSPDFPAEAPEITAITGVRHKLSLDTVIGDIIAGKAPLKTAQFILGLPMTRQANSFRAFWKRSKSIQEADWTTFFKFYWPGFDAWCVGVIILKLYSYVSRSPAYTVAVEWKELSGRIIEVLRVLLRMNPVERRDCVEALYMFNPDSPVLASESAMKWIGDREKMRRI